MQCPSCRQEASGAFCNFCGATLAAAAPAGPGGVAPPPPPAAVATSSGLSNNAAAAIAYLTIIPSIIFLLIDPYKRIPLVRFHSIQNLALAVVWIGFWIVMAVFSIMVMHFALFLGFLLLALEWIAGIAVFIAWLVAIIKASQGQFFKLPFIGDFALKMANA